MHKMLRFILTLVMPVMIVQACVTVTDGPTSTVDKRAAVEKYVQLGMRYISSGNRDGAVGAFTNALKIDKKSAEAHQGIGMVYQLNGENALAEKSFLKALKGRVDFSLSAIQFSYGRFLFENERLEEALKYFEFASKDLQYRGRANALYMVGRSSRMLGETERARGALEFALNLNSNLSGAALDLAEMAVDEEDYVTAKKYLDQFIENARHTPRSLWLGIRIEKIFGNKDKEASYAMSLKNMHPYSQEYLDYKRFSEQEGK